MLWYGPCPAAVCRCSNRYEGCVADAADFVMCEICALGFICAMGADEPRRDVGRISGGPVLIWMLVAIPPDAADPRRPSASQSMTLGRGV